MSLLLEKKGTSAPLPRLDGKEVLVGPNPEVAKVKGVMFGGRKQFLIDATGEHFPKEEQAMKQGGTRYERAHRYVANARAAASRLGIECAWKIIDVPDVGHEGDRMSVAAAPVLGPQLGLPG